MTIRTGTRGMHENFRRVLAGAQQERGQREHVVDTPDGPEPGWAVHERHVMLLEINRIRETSGLERVDLDAVTRVERMAAGHSDYSSKFALYCAELALKEAS